MSSSTDALTLASLPPDIIKSIIRMNTRDCMDGMRTISQEWNRLVGYFLKELPPVEHAGIVLSLDKKHLSFTIEIGTNYRNHFETILPKTVNSRNELASMTYKFECPIDDPSTMDFISRLFRSTNLIKIFGLEQLDKKILDIICNLMRNVKVTQMNFCFMKFDCGMRQPFKEFVRLHQVDTVKILTNDNLYDEELLISIEVPDNDKMKSRESMLYWGKLARYLINNQGKRMVECASGDSVVCQKVDYAGQFMYNFFHYDLF